MKFEKEIVLKDIYDYGGYGNLRFNNEFSCEEIKELYYKMARKKAKLTLEIEEPILDEKEKEYLRGVIRPFRNKVKNIHKIKIFPTGEERIIIVGKSNLYMPFPIFKKGTMYKNMKIDKEYTLEELGL